MYSGSEFQMEEAAAGKARLPTVESLTDGTMRRLVAVERRVRRLGTSVPGIAVRYREELVNPARRPCIVCAPVPAANEG